MLRLKIKHMGKRLLPNGCFTAVKRVKFAKVKAKYFKVKVATFTIESLRYYQHPVSLLNFLKVY